MTGAEAIHHDLLDNRYRLEELLGRGGMAVVYRATDTRLDRQVAIKILGDAPAADDRRFRSEVRTLARFSHPNLVRVLDAGEADHSLYLVMDLIDGPTLADRLRAGPLSPQEAAKVGAGIAAALSYVHGEGFVHRDVKPGNILLDNRGIPYLADFGISRLLDTTGLTTTGQFVGTPAYLAPEQMHRQDIGPAADVYALGLVLLECLSGERAFTGTLPEIAAARMLQGPAIPTALEPRWATLLQSMTDTDPERRVGVEKAAGTLASWAHPPSDSAGDTPTVEGTAATAPMALPGDTPTIRQTTETRTLRAPKRAPAEGTGRSGPGIRSASEHRRRQVAPLVVASVIALLLGLGLGAELLGARVGKAKQSVSSGHTTTVRSPARTTTITVTKATAAPVKSLAEASGRFVTRLLAGETVGNVSSQAAQQLFAQLQSIPTSSSGDPGQQVQQFDQLVQTLNLEIFTGQVVGSSVSSLRSAISTLAKVLGTTVPSPAVVQTSPNKGNGNGNGNGKGNGPPGQS